MCPPNPADLLGSKKMREVLATLRDSYHFIVIDSPPAVAITDAAVLSVLADGVILVFHGRKTTTASARQLIERMDVVHAPVLGVVLNSVDLQDPHFAYYGSYRSYYSDAEVASDNHIRSAQDSIQQADCSLSHEAQVNGINGTHDAAVPVQAAASKVNHTEPSQNITETGHHLTNALEANGNDGSVASKDGTIERELGAEFASQESLNRLITAVTKSLGPIAPQVVREQIANLGESFTAFPMGRIGELVKLLQREITQRTNGSQIPESPKASKA
jgi:hypothetical protein